MQGSVLRYNKLPHSVNNKLPPSLESLTAENTAKQRWSWLQVAFPVVCFLVAYQCISNLQPSCPTAKVISMATSTSVAAPVQSSTAAAAAVREDTDRQQPVVSVETSVPSATAAADHFNSSRCPVWLSQYEQWHAANRGAAGAKYLIADAPGFVGVGDHLRGFMYALRVAAATDRVLLLRWEHPGNLTDFLVPGSSINWTWQGVEPAQALLLSDPNLRASSADVGVFTNNDLGRAFPAGQFFTHGLSNKTFLVLKTNFPAGQSCEICPAVVGKEAEEYDFVCMFRALFKPSALVNQKTDEYLQQLYPSYGGSGIELDYQAVHLRLGQMQGESSVIHRIAYSDPLAMLLLSVSCGTGMAADAGVDITAVPMLLLADHKGVRKFSQQGGLANVVSPSYLAVHTKLNSLESHLQSFVDINLIARAKCAVLSHSGFSNVGWWMGGGNPCVMMLSDCYKRCTANKSSSRDDSVSCPLT